MASRTTTIRAKAPATTSRKAAPAVSAKQATAQREPHEEPQAKTRRRSASPAASASRPTEPTVATGASVEAGRSGNKLVRDSFTIPKREYTLLQQLKERAAALKRPAKKSEVLRAGIVALSAMSDEAFHAVLASVPSLKTGRPKQGRDAKAAQA